YDNDGDLDLFVTNQQSNFLYTNNGDGLFARVTTGAVTTDWSESYGSSWCDYDNDGDLDLFVANRGESNCLYANNGDGTFLKVTDGPVVTDGGYSRGGSWGDYDNDGDLDLFVTNQQTNFLYTNHGDGLFARVTTGLIVTDTSDSYGSSWGDYDNDGDLDLFVSNIDGNNCLYANNGDGSFNKVTTATVVNDEKASTGCSWGDYDGDGDLDLFVANADQDNLLYINRGSSNSWVNIQLVGTVSNRSAIGAKVWIKATVDAETPIWQLQEIASQTGYASQNSLNAEFGLGIATVIDSIRIEWPSGLMQVLTDVAVNQFLIIEEGHRGPAATDLVVSPDTAMLGQSVTVQATFEDASIIQSVNLMHIMGDTSHYVAVAMDYTGNNIYSGTIPGTSVTLAGLAYFLVSRDNLGFVNHSDTLSIPVEFPDYTLTSGVPSSTFSSGFPMHKWRLISIPAELDQPSVIATIGDELGNRTKKTWRIFSLEGGEYEENPADFDPGKGYWLYQRTSESITFSTGAGKSSDLTGHSLILYPGWNFIGSPYTFTVPLDVDQGEFYGPLTYGLDDTTEGWSDTIDELLPWAGYAIYNRSPSSVTLEINPLASSLRLAKEQTVAPEGWTLRISAVGQTYSDVGNYIGRLEGAKDQLDCFDNPEPPYIDGYLSLVMERPAWGTSITRFTSDIRSFDGMNGVWGMEIFTKEESGPITFTSELEGEVPVDFCVFLLDAVTRRSHDLLYGNNPVTITDYREGFPYHLKAVAGSRAWVDAKVQEILAQLPKEFALYQNFPNPFNPNTSLRYELPIATDVVLVVYDILGREVIRLVDEPNEAGYHQVIWQGQDRFGRSLASGVYIYRLVTPQYSRARKMLLLK
ncbi:MAG: FG-GAP-like repeat-containing protein, partial [Candidatus Neomarinimicrobiota bacterium]